MIIRTTLIFCLCLIAPPILSAAAISEMENIKSLYAKTNQAIADGKTRQVFYYNTNNGWKKTANPKAVGFKDVGEDRMLEQVHIYLHQNRVIKAVIFIDTPSGDWANKREYYFYDTGKTAFLFETHLTFLGYDNETQRPLPKGPYIVERRIYFDSNEKELRKLEKAFVSKSKESVPVRFLQKIDPEIYTNVNRLPVFSLLGQEKQ